MPANDEDNGAAGNYEMKGSVGVTDNDWFANVILLKQVGSKAQGLRLKAASLTGQRERMRVWEQASTLTRHRNCGQAAGKPATHLSFQL